MVAELKVTIKDDAKKLIKEFLVYETFTTAEDDPIITKYKDETLENFNGEPDDIFVNIKIQIK